MSKKAGMRKFTEGEKEVDVRNVGQAGGKDPVGHRKERISESLT